MKIYQLRARQPLDPSWLNRVRYDRHEAVVADDGRVELQGEWLTFEADDLPAGTGVYVWLGRTFLCAATADFQAEQDERERQAAASREREREYLNRLRAEAEAFNARLRLPVAWVTGFKSVLSGLSERSWGDGRSRSTVDHILLTEGFEQGKLRRSAGDFLCSSSALGNGKRWLGAESQATDGEGNRYMPRVTCRVCLKLAERWMAPVVEV